MPCIVGGDWGGNQQFGTGYQNSFGGGVMKGGGYGQRGQGPYGGGKWHPCTILFTALH